jgi:hypothetical protein
MTTKKRPSKKTAKKKTAKKKTAVANKSTSSGAGAKAIEKLLAPATPAQRAMIEELRDVIRAAAPGATEGVSYAMPAFFHSGSALVAYAPWKEHIGFYPMSGSILGEHGSS